MMEGSISSPLVRLTHPLVPAHHLRALPFVLSKHAIPGTKSERPGLPAVTYHRQATE